MDGDGEREYVEKREEGARRGTWPVRSSAGCSSDSISPHACPHQQSPSLSPTPCVCVCVCVLGVGYRAVVLVAFDACR